jgi:hypothetical protein
MRGYYQKMKFRLTHRDVVHLKLVGFVIVTVHSGLAYCKSCSNANGKFEWTIRGGREDLVDVVHCWDDRCKVWRSTGEKERSVFVNLKRLTRVSIGIINHKISDEPLKLLQPFRLSSILQKQAHNHGDQDLEQPSSNRLPLDI